MRLTRFNLSQFRPVRIVVAFFACALMLFSFATPAYSDGYKDPTFSSSPSSPTKGEAPINETYEKSEEALQQSPPSLEKQQAETDNGGLNAAQGTADYEKMNRPENSQNAKTVEQSAEKALKKLTGRD